MTTLASLWCISARTSSSAFYVRARPSVTQNLRRLSPNTMTPIQNNWRTSVPAIRFLSATNRRSLRGVDGRIAVEQSSLKKKVKKSKTPKLCSGCGVEVLEGASSSTRMTTGEEAIHPSHSNKRKKLARFLDPTDRGSGNFLCHRCKALQSNDIWKAYDALRDVEPEVFINQVRHIVSRRQFGVCLMVVDATDPEHTAVRKLRKAIGKIPAILVLNKIDLLPRLIKRDQNQLAHTVKNATRFTEHYAVSAETGAGLVNLAIGLLENLGGRDVFVVGTANVGKSTLVKKLSPIIADSVYMKRKKDAHRCRDVSSNLKVTGSSLPGTTLQAVRVPCLPSKRHALWDTPGIINSRALQYCIFPSHLMEPLTHPCKIEVPSRENGLAFKLRPGRSVLIEAPWMNKEDGGDEDSKENLESRSHPCVLGRIDLVHADGIVDVRAYIHPSLTIHIVPTESAPSTATIPPTHIARVKQRIKKATKQEETGLKDEYSMPLEANMSIPRGELSPGRKEYCEFSGRYTMDVCFPSLGWISFVDSNSFTVIPYCVEGSVFSKRRALYPLSLARWLTENENPELEPDILDKEAIREIDIAARRGRHVANRPKEEEEDSDGEYDQYDEWF